MASAVRRGMARSTAAVSWRDASKRRASRSHGCVEAHGRAAGGRTCSLLLHDCTAAARGGWGHQHWLASYQGRNNIREQRWCSPAPATWKIIAFRDRLVLKLYRLGLLSKPS